MDTNFFSFTSSSFSSQHFPDNSSLDSLFSDCIDSFFSVLIFTGFTSTFSVLLFPLAIIILRLGLRRYRQHHSACYCDIITYHMVAMEMMCILGSWLYCVGAFVHHHRLSMGASLLFMVTSCGRMLFLVLTCVELYLAVVHPIRYLKLKQGRGLILKGSLIWSVWLLGFTEMMSCVSERSIDYIFILYFGHQMFSLAVISFCSFSVLRALKRPGPGEGTGDRERPDQSKQRSFYTIIAIMVTLVLSFVGNLVCSAVYSSPQTTLDVSCVSIVLSDWLGLPSNLVVPLLFLHRAGKLPLCDHRSG